MNDLCKRIAAIAPKEWGELEYHGWRPVYADGAHVERPSKETVQVWTWNGFDAVLTEGTVFERCPRMPDPDPAMRAQRGFWEQEMAKARTTPDLSKPKHYVFSVPASDRGYGNPFRDYFVNSSQIGSLYRFTRDDLLMAVLDLTEREYKRVAPEYERLKARRDRIHAMLEGETEE